MRMSRLFEIAIIITIIFLDLSVESKIFAADLHVVRSHSETQNPRVPIVKMPKGLSSACTAWTDGCRTCGRNPDGVFCSNVGIACQPSELHCIRP